MGHKWTHSLAWERTLTGDSREQLTTRERSPVLLALSGIYLRQAHFWENVAMTADECKVNLLQKMKFKQRLIILFLFFLWQLDPTVSMTAIFSHSFPKIDIHFVSVQQLALVVCIARSPARKKRETGKWQTKSTPKKCNIQERFLLALASFDKLCENQKQLQLNHVASSYVSKLTKLFTLCKGSLIVMNIST